MKRCLLGPPSSQRRLQGEELSGPWGKESPVATSKVTAYPHATFRPQGGAGPAGGGPEWARAGEHSHARMTGRERDVGCGAAWGADQPPAGTELLSEAGLLPAEQHMPSVPSPNRDAELGGRGGHEAAAGFIWGQNCPPNKAEGPEPEAQLWARGQTRRGHAGPGRQPEQPGCKATVAAGYGAACCGLLPAPQPLGRDGLHLRPPGRACVSGGHAALSPYKQ